MRFLVSFMTIPFFLLNAIAPNNTEDKYPKIIDAFTLAYEAMYTQGNFNKDYIILDMESYDFSNKTYEERQNTINYVSPIAAKFYTIKLKVEKNKWVLKNITLTVVA